MSIDRVRAILAHLERTGASVVLTPSSREDLAASRARLGFDPPTDYASLCLELGGITIELERTWYFYGANDSLIKTAEYARELDAFRGEEGPYYPSRFFVFADEGDYSNAATGWVWDADLGAFFHTDGGRWCDREDARDVDTWTPDRGARNDPRAYRRPGRRRVAFLIIAAAKL